MEKHEFREVFEEAFTAFFEKRDEAANLTRDTHAEHHAWVAARIVEQQERAHFWRTMRTKSIPWLIAALLSWAGTQLWVQVTSFAKEHWK